MRKKWKFLGVITFVVPVLIMTYYAVIGGWILKYMTIYIFGSGKDAVADNCFTNFISSPSSVWFGIIFILLTAIIVYNGVEKGIERVSKFIMPVLLILVIGIAIFSLTLKTTLDDGTVRTGLQGLKVYLKPDMSGITDIPSGGGRGGGFPPSQAPDRVYWPGKGQGKPVRIH